MTETIHKGYQRPFYAAPSPTTSELFVCDFSADEVRSSRTRLAGFRGPHSIDWDNEGNLYICEYYASQIQKITLEGPHEIFLKNLEGPATAFFNNEKDLLYVTLFTGDRVEIYDLLGRKQGELEGEFHRPHCCTFDSEGSIYVADTHNHQIQKFSSQGELLLKFGHGRLAEPVSISIEGEFLYSTEFCSDAVKRFDLKGRFVDVVTTGLLHPYGIKVKDGKLYIADSDHGCVKVVSIEAHEQRHLHSL